LPVSMKSGSARKLDYREVLSEADFEVFARLRLLRKQVAERDGVPPYAVFSNEQLADLVRQRATTSSAMARIEGIGAARVERYAAVFLPVLQACFTKVSSEAPGDHA
jgi:superfamily II DNA helicase RecQ